MSGKPKYHVGDQFGMLTLIADTGKRTKNGNVIWRCKCECGNIIERRADSFQLSMKLHCDISCGCVQREKSRKRNIGKLYAYDENRIKLAREAIMPYKGTTKQGIISRDPHKGNKNGSTGIRGVTKKRDGYYGQLMFQRQYHIKGPFKTIEEAYEARKELEEIYFKPMIKEMEGLYNDNQR